MKNLTSTELRNSFLEYFKNHGHAIIPSASLIPENDPTVLFTTAGMHPLVPYLLGETHPMGKRLVNVQKCIRTGDIEEVGDASHLTFFEMLGNWSLGDYFKKEAIEWSFAFLTGEKYLNIDIDELAVSVFEGDENTPRDEESAEIWQSLGLPKERIFYLGKEHNWWGPAGKTGPCGPDTEMFIIRNQAPCGDDCSPACDCGRYLEVWNDVFMQYNMQEDGSLLPLEHPNVDTGMGLERMVTVLQGVETVYESDLFTPIIQNIEKLSQKKYGEDEETTRAMRIVADHIRAATFILGDDKPVTPSNVDQGYVLRRLIRRALRFSDQQLGMESGSIAKIAEGIIHQYEKAHPELLEHQELILAEINTEEERFAKTIEAGMKEFEKVVRQSPLIRAVSAARRNKEEQEKLVLRLAEFEAYLKEHNHPIWLEHVSNLKQYIESKEFDETPIIQHYRLLRDSIKEQLQNTTAVQEFEKLENKLRKLDPAKNVQIEDMLQIASNRTFRLYDTFGFPFELTRELAEERGLSVDEEAFEKLFEEHRKKSQAGAKERFAGGLADSTEETTKLHTATHILLSALRKILSEDIEQRGSNITADRLRFDFNFDRKLTDEELKEIEDMVNGVIEADLPITYTEMSVEDALAQGAIGAFGDRYGQKVRVYSMGDFSKEICGGPHMEHTGALGKFKITKEQSSSAGVRRIRATLEP